MFRPLTAFTILYGLILAGWALGAAIRRRHPGTTYLAALLVLQAVLVVHAALDVGSLLAGHQVASPATHLGYTLASVGLLPLLLGAPGRDREAGPWRAAVLAIGCLAISVVTVRQWATWQAVDV